MILEPGITIINEAEIPEARISLRSDGIVHVHFHKDTTFDIPLQASMRDVYDKMLQGRKAKFIFSADEGFTLTKEVRERADLQDNSSILCYAMVVNNLAYKIIADFYIRVTKPKGNYKLVTSLADAVKWLNSVKEA
jgi:hypothetical protein